MSGNRVSDERLEWVRAHVAKGALMREGVARQEWNDLRDAIEELQDRRTKEAAISAVLDMAGEFVSRKCHSVSDAEDWQDRIGKTFDSLRETAQPTQAPLTGGALDKEE